MVRMVVKVVMGMVSAGMVAIEVVWMHGRRVIHVGAAVVVVVIILPQIRDHVRWRRRHRRVRRLRVQNRHRFLNQRRLR